MTIVEKLRRLVIGASLVGLVAIWQITPAHADDFRTVLIYDLGGKFDRSFNEAAYKGAEKFREETNIRYRDFEPTNEAQFEQALRRFARRKADLIVAIGVSYKVPLRNVAREFPDQRFTAVDASVDLPNVQSILFKEHEGSFLVGMLAAMKAENATIGFIGGMDIPLIRRFGLGYAEGAKYVNPDIRILRNMVGTTPSAWSDPIKGAELARSQYARGADIIFAAAGPAGLGVLQAARDAEKFAIGVDSNQNHIQPGYVLTSMLKRVDLAVYRAMAEGRDGSWKPGITILGLKEAGVDYAVDDHNRSLMTSEMIERLEAAKKKIVSGAITVTDAMADDQSGGH
ncbi:MAG: BMP family protein [Sphingomonadales bacterium]